MRAAIVLLGVVAASSARAEVIEVTAEEDGAVDAAKAEVARSQQLGKDKDYAGAVAVLETVARQHPASEHDCNLALAYLRAGDPTRAQLWADVAAKRGGARPKWCKKKLPGQLAAALDGLQPVTLVIAPADALIEIDGISLRGLAVIWLAPGAHTVSASADGYEASTTQVAVTDAPARATLELEVYVPPPEEPAKPPIVVSEGPALRAGPESKDSSKDSPMTWPGWLAAGLGGAAIAVGGYFHAGALDARDEADMRYPSDPAFDALVSDFRGDRTAAIAGYTVGTALIAAGAWWLLTHGWRP